MEREETKKPSQLRDGFHLQRSKIFAPLFFLLSGLFLLSGFLLSSFLLSYFLFRCFLLCHSVESFG